VPSSYVGCQISDESLEALNAFGRSLEEARVDALYKIAQLASAIADLSAAETHASLTLGTVALDNQITWTAVTAGDSGNGLQVFYDYQGPIVNPLAPSGFDPRPPSSYVDALGIIHCILPVDTSGQIDPAFPVSLCLPVWMADSAVQALVTGALVGIGTGLPQPTGVLKLSGGRSSVLPDAESSADDVARVLGKPSYVSLLRSISVPVTTTKAEAAAYLESIDSATVIINGKVFTLGGTNLVGINALYLKLNKSVSNLKEKLVLVAKTSKLVYLLSTENVSSLSYDLVCNVPVPVTTVTETPRSWDTRVTITAAQWTGGNGAALNHYLFWNGSISPSAMSQQKLVSLGIPAVYWPSIMAGTNPPAGLDSSVTAPVVYLIEDPDLLNKLHLNDTELAELLDKQISGIKLPSQVSVADLSKQVRRILGNTKNRLANGMRHQIKSPLAAAKVMNLGSSFNDSSRLQELATRGRACARLPGLSPSVPSADLPNLPTASLPNEARRLESLYASLSAAVQRALEVFDQTFSEAEKTCEGLLDKLQNLSGLEENLLNNDLAKCLAGLGGTATGVPDSSALGPSGSWGGSGGLSSGSMPSVGGLPIPMSAFTSFMSSMTAKVEQTINKSFSEMMKSIRVPLCLATGVMSAMSKIDLGSLSAPCKDALDPDNKCPPAEVQDIINESSDLSAMTATMPQLEGLPTTSTATAVTEKVQNFTGQVQTATETTQQSVTRGIKQVVDEVNESLQTKLQLVDKVMQSVQHLIGDMTEQRLTASETSAQQGKCGAPSVGMFTDQITALL
jgi:hypothetical protein